MLRDVRHTVTDGLLGLSGDQGEGVHIKIGVSPVKSKGPIIITGTSTAAKMKEKLGLSPLADSVMDSCENGAGKVICIPAGASAKGTITEAESKSEGTCSMTGEPYNVFSVKVEMTGKGGLNMAAFRYTTDGGASWSEDLTVPLSGEYELAGTGLKLAFALDEGKSFAVGDSFSWTTTAPKMTGPDVLKALDSLKHLNVEAEFVHIVGGMTPELWAAASEVQKELAESYHKVFFFVLEAYEPEVGEEPEAYVERLKEDRKKVKNYDIQVVAARGVYTGMDGLTRETNLAGLVCGFYAKTKVHKSIGETAVISVQEGKLTLRPEGIEEHIGELDESGYLTFRQYDGLAGYYVTNARMMSPEGSDYRYAEDVRVKNKIIRKTRLEALKQLQSEVDLSDIDGDLKAKAQFIQAPLENMVETGEISAVQVDVPGGQDILKTETLELVIRYVPRGTIREIVIDLGVNNPGAAS